MQAQNNMSCTCLHTELVVIDSRSAAFSIPCTVANSSPSCRERDKDHGQPQGGGAIGPLTVGIELSFSSSSYKEQNRSQLDCSIYTPPPTSSSSSSSSSSSTSLAELVDFFALLVRPPLVPFLLLEDRLRSVTSDQNSIILISS